MRWLKAEALRKSSAQKWKGTGGAAASAKKRKGTGAAAAAAEQKRKGMGELHRRRFI